MNRSSQIVLSLLFGITLVGCGSSPYSGNTRYYQSSATTLSGPLSETEHEIRAALLQQYQEWQGTPYRLGGVSRAGIDCSGFTQVTYRSRFNQYLPRTTKAQASQGVQIDTQTMAPGDLLFFNTGVKVRHVGIYMGQGEFLHASTSQGVTISRLSNPYWQNSFWQVRRVNQTVN